MDFTSLFRRKKAKKPATTLPPPRPPSASSPQRIPQPPARPDAAPSTLEQDTQNEFENSVQPEPARPSASPDDVLSSPSGKATLKVVQDLIQSAAQKREELEHRIAEDPQQPPSRPDPFYLHSGTVLHDIDDLAASLHTMDERTFSHHVTGDRNDFAAWIRHSLSDEQTADRILNVSSVEELAGILHEDIDPLPDIREQEQEPEDIPLDDLSGMREHFAHLRDEINAEIDESISLLHTQSDRITTLREEVKQSSEDLATREAQLRNELSRMRSEQDALRDEISHLKDENERLITERNDARQVQSEVRQIREQLRSKHEELMTARRLLKEQLSKRGIQQAQEELSSVESKQPSKYHPSAEHLRALIETVKEDIEAGRYNAARHGYNDAREAFYKATTLSSDERHELHQDIMDIYTQIHLHEMD